MHSDVIVSGSPNVRANNLGVHRAMDMFMCPIVGIGITMVGSTTVRANGQMLARMTSIGMCLTPNTIASGSPNVRCG